MTRPQPAAAHSLSSRPALEELELKSALSAFLSLESELQAPVVVPRRTPYGTRPEHRDPRPMACVIRIMGHEPGHLPPPSPPTQTLAGPCQWPPLPHDFAAARQLPTRVHAPRCARPAREPDYSSVLTGHVPPVGFYNRFNLEHTSERPKPRRHEAALPPRAECPRSSRSVVSRAVPGQGSHDRIRCRHPPWRPLATVDLPRPARARAPHVTGGCPRGAGVRSSRAAVR